MRFPSQLIYIVPIMSHSPEKVQIESYMKYIRVHTYSFTLGLLISYKHFSNNLYIFLLR